MPSIPLPKKDFIHHEKLEIKSDSNPDSTFFKSIKEFIMNPLVLIILLFLIALYFYSISKI